METQPQLKENNLVLSGVLESPAEHIRKLRQPDSPTPLYEHSRRMRPQNINRCLSQAPAAFENETAENSRLTSGLL